MVSFSPLSRDLSLNNSSKFVSHELVGIVIWSRLPRVAFTEIQAKRDWSHGLMELMRRSFNRKCVSRIISDSVDHLIEISAFFNLWSSSLPTIWLYFSVFFMKTLILSNKWSRANRFKWPTLSGTRCSTFLTTYSHCDLFVISLWEGASDWFDEIGSDQVISINDHSITHSSANIFHSCGCETGPNISKDIHLTPF